MKKMKCIKTSKSKEGVEWFSEGNEYEVVSENKETGSYLLVANNGEKVKCIRTKRGKNFVEAVDVPKTLKKVICVRPEHGILTVGKVYGVFKETPTGEFEIVSDLGKPYYCSMPLSPESHFKPYVKPEETVIAWNDKGKQSVTIEVPDGYKIKSQKVVDNQIVVELEEKKPVFKLGDVLTNGHLIWIRDINGDAILMYNNVGHRLVEKYAVNFPPDIIRYANYEERCKFFEALVKAGYKWNSKKLKLSKVEPKPKQNIVVVSSTDTVLTIKAEFLEKLKALGVYDKWLSNVKAQYGTSSCHPELWVNWRSFINWSFTWSDTPERIVFWSVIIQK